MISDRSPTADLTRLADRYGTDKGDACGERHGYTHVYGRLFAPLRELPIAVLELGVAAGASLRMWADWFPRARIYGIDDRPPPDLGHERITVVAGDCRQPPPELRDLAFDLVVDDASHRSSATLLALDAWRFRVRPFGFYVIEDLHANLRDPAVYADTSPDALSRCRAWQQAPPLPFASCTLLDDKLAILRRGA